MIKFVFCTAVNLSDRYKKNIGRRLLKAKNFPFAAEQGNEVRVLVGDWTLYRETDNETMPRFFLTREQVKDILGVKRLKEWDCDGRCMQVDMRPGVINALCNKHAKEIGLPL